MAKKGGLILTPDVQADLKMAALGRDVRALGAVWNRTRARLVAEVERLGRLEAALEDDGLAYDAAVAACSEDGCAIEDYRDALRAAMQAGPDQDGKEANK